MADTKAINHILVNNYSYQKPEAVRYDLGRIVGRGLHHVSLPFRPLPNSIHLILGLLTVEEDKHKQQVPVISCVISHDPKFFPA